MKTIVVANQKGGTGKTTIAATLAWGLGIYGSRVLAIDLDTQGQLATLLGAEPGPQATQWLTGDTKAANVTTISANLALIRGGKSTETAVETLLGANGHQLPANLIHLHLNPARRVADYAVIDTGPAASQLQAVALWAADLAIIPVLCDPLSLAGLDAMIHTLAALGDHAPQVLIQPNQYDRRRKLDRDILAALRETYGRLVQPAIHVDADIGRAAAAGKVVYQTKQAGKAAEQFDTLCWAVKHA